MQVSDELMFNYYEMLTDVSLAEIERLKSIHPMESKIALARRIVTDFHSAADAGRAEAEFTRVVRQREIPSEIETVPLPEDLKADGAIPIDKLLARIGLAESVSDAVRKRKAGAVVIDGQKQLDPKYPQTAGAVHTIQVGKKWRRVAV